jgi:hypothetical protein
MSHAVVSSSPSAAGADIAIQPQFGGAAASGLTADIWLCAAASAAATANESLLRELLRSIHILSEEGASSSHVLGRSTTLA